MAIPHGDPDHERAKFRGPWWNLLPPPPSSTDPNPYAPVPIVPPLPSPSREVESSYPAWLLPYIRGLPMQDKSYAPAPRGLPALLNEGGGQEPVDQNAPPAGGLLGIIEQYLRDSRQRGYPLPEK